MTDGRLTIPFLKRRAIAAIMAVGSVVVLCGSGVAAAETRSVTINASADTTYSQVPQDGDGRAKTTLATCPQSCEGNLAGEREAVVEFKVADLPQGATGISARLELYSWSPFAATTTTAYKAAGGASAPGDWATRPALGAALGSSTAVTAGYNAWNVSSAVTGNGTVTFAVRQSTRNARTYWASAENSSAEIRPRLVVTYTTPAEPADWRLVWSDEFDGTALDGQKWNKVTGSVDYDKACITDRPSNVFVRDGMLTLRVLKENHPCAGTTRPYTTGYVDTRGGKASFAYGRFEARVKSPNGPTNSKGLWPAFWLRPDDGDNGEIDVTELPGGAQYYKASTMAIFRDYTPTKNDFRYTFPTGYPGDGFHTYTTEWEPGVIRWYIDGREVWRRDNTTTPWLEETFGGDLNYRRKFNIRLNFQVGGWLGDPDASTSFPADFQVDYVRVWQR